MVKDPNTIEYLEAALRATSLRGKVTANNVANLNTPGFKRAVVEFEKRLAEAMESSRPVDPAGLEMQIIRPKNTRVDETGNDVSLEVEVGEMVKNSAAYKAYIRILSKLYRQMEAAMDVR